MARLNRPGPFNRGPFTGPTDASVPAGLFPAGQETGRGSNRLQSGRADVFQNLLLTTLAVAAAYAHGQQYSRTIQAVQNRSEPVQNLQQTMFASVAVASPDVNPDMGRPHGLQTVRDDDLGTPFGLLAQATVQTPAVPPEFSRPVALRSGKDDQLGSWRYFFPSTEPRVGAEHGRPAQTLKPERTDQLGTPAGLLAQASIAAPVIPADLGRPRSLQSGRDDELGSPFGLIQQLQTVGQKNGDLGRPVALSRNGDAPTGTPRLLFTAAPTNPVVSPDYSRPQTLKAGRDATEYGQPYQVRPLLAAVSTREPLLSQARPLRGLRDGWDATGSARMLFTVTPTTPFIPVDFSRPNGLKQGRDATEYGQPFQLKSLLGAVSTREPLLSQARKLRINPAEPVQNLHQTVFVSQDVFVFGGWDEGVPLRLTIKKDEPQGRNLLLSYSAAPKPFAQSDLVTRPVPLKANRSDTLGTPVGLLAVAATTPFRGLEIPGRPQVLPAGRSDTLGTPAGLLASVVQRPVAQSDLATRPQALKAGRSDQLGTPSGLLTQVVQTPAVSADFSRPQALARQRTDQLGSPIWLFTQASTPVRSSDYSRPLRLDNRRDDVFQRLILAQTAALRSATLDGVRPNAVHRVRLEVLPLPLPGIWYAQAPAPVIYPKPFVAERERGLYEAVREPGCKAAEERQLFEAEGEQVFEAEQEQPTYPLRE